jgi:hypothetical protein
MRSVFTLFIAILLSSAAFAFNEGKLTITLPSDEFTVTVNGMIYQMIGNTVTVENIKAGEYRVKIYRYGGNTAGNMRQSREPLYNSFIVIKPSYHVDMMINRFGKIYVDEQAIMGRTADRYQRKNNWKNNFAMSDQDFTGLISRVKQLRFTDEKMAIIREAAMRNQFYTGQVVQLMQQFNFESDKLELAKLLYRSTADKNNFYIIYGEFRFSSTRTELEKYIEEIRYQ